MFELFALGDGELCGTPAPEGRVVLAVESGPDIPEGVVAEFENVPCFEGTRLAVVAFGKTIVAGGQLDEDLGSSPPIIQLTLSTSGAPLFGDFSGYLEYLETERPCTQNTPQYRGSLRLSPL